jgi:hypothetical protein
LLVFELGGWRGVKVEESDQTVTVEQNYHIVDTPTMKRPHGKWTIRPDRLTVVWRGREWMHLTVRGPIQHPDRPGENLGRYTLSYYNWSEVPQWLKEFVETQKPAQL